MPAKSSVVIPRTGAATFSNMPIAITHVMLFILAPLGRKMATDDDHSLCHFYPLARIFVSPGPFAVKTALDPAFDPE